MSHLSHQTNYLKIDLRYASKDNFLDTVVRIFQVSVEKIMEKKQMHIFKDQQLKL